MSRCLWSWAVLALIAGCQPEDKTVQPPQTPVRPLIKQEASAHREAYQAAMARAVLWLAKLPIETPQELRAKKLKGKKKFVELLDTYARLYRVAPAQERPSLLARLKALEQITRDASYHDMRALSDVEFKQDATSYLRAAFILDRLGFDTTTYQGHIKDIQARMDAHLPSRGSHQRMAIALYYEHFKLPFPPQIDSTPSLIHARKDPYTYTTLDAYHLTHEIFVPYEFGDNLNARPFTPDDLAYIERTLQRLMVYYIMRKNVDLVAELLMCMKYLKLEHDVLYDEGLHYLLNAQNADGSWGSYQQQAKQYGDELDVALYLHTVMVVIDALSLAMEPEPEKWLRLTIHHDGAR